MPTERDETELVGKLDAAKTRNAAILVLLEANWSHRQVGQALDMTKSAVAGVLKRCRDRRVAA